MVMIILTEVTVKMVMVNYDYILNTVSYDKSANMEDGLAVTSNKSLNQEIVNSEYRILPSDITISFIHTQQLVRKQHLPHTFIIFLNFK